MSIRPEFLDELRRRLTLSQIVGRRVRLIRKGREHQGLCPFHKEKTPSFYVNDEKAFYHCFGCGAHGDAVSFLIEQEGLSFPEAVERLAVEAGMEVPRGPRDEAREHRLRDGYGALEAACAYFEKALASPAGRVARDYLAGRGLSAADIARFRLGFSPDRRDGLKTALIGEGFAEDLLIEAGLLIKPEEGGASFDRFRGRVMFAIQDPRGRVIGFGGRAQGDAQPKYLNSPETPFFHKGRVLYAHHLARAAAQRAGTVLVAEGYMDVVALHRVGFTHAVAPLGTALTEDQLGLLWRMAREPVLCFDGDKAGQAAALRAIERALPLLTSERTLRVAFLPQGQDPDDLLRAPDGVAKLRALLDAAKPLVDALWEHEVALEPLTTPERRAGLAKRLAARARVIEDGELRRHYEVEFERRRRALTGVARPPEPNGSRRPNRGRFVRGRGFEPDPYIKSAPSDDVEAATLARPLLALTLNHPRIALEFAEELARISFHDPRLDSVLGVILESIAALPDLDGPTLQRHLASLTEAGAIDRVLDPQVMKAFPTARASADPAKVRESFVGFFAQCERRAQKRELVEARARAIAARDGEELARLDSALAALESEAG